MAYLWENYSEKKDYQFDERICPYIEVLNQNTQTVNVNPLIRFSKIFNASFVDVDEDRFAFDALTDSIGEEGVKQIVNIMFHYLAQLDRTKGMDSSQRLIEELRNEIDCGIWGKKIQELLGELTEADRECVLYVLSRRIRYDNQSSFMEVIGRVFPVSSLCFEEKTKLFYLYVASEETDYNAKKLNLIKTLFWTLNKDLKVIWNHHYGIIGCDDTMHINSIQVV